MEGGSDIVAAEVGCDVGEVWGPVHSAGGISIGETDVVDVHAGGFAVNATKRVQSISLKFGLASARFEEDTRRSKN